MSRILAGAALATVGLAITVLSADPPATQSDDVPLLVREPSAGDWVVDRYAGNTTAGTIFFQGPAVQAGGVGRSTSLAVAPDGRTFFPVSEGIAEVSADGTLRLVVSKQEWKADGLDDLYGRGGLLAWNSKDDCLCFWGRGCIRKLVEKPDGSHEVVRVVGDPKRPGTQDGPAATATLNSVGDLCINGRGAVFFYDARNRYGDCLRKFEDGVVTTITDKMRTGRLVDGPLADACFNFINLGGLNCVGENDDVLYIADHWNFAIRRIDLKADQVSTVAGMPKPAPGSPPADRFGKHADGPALTMASCNSGCVFAVYDPVHKALWMGGPDEGRLRWLKDGWVKTVMGSQPGQWDLDGFGNPADQVKMSWCWVLAVDRQGRAYVMNGASKTGYWRLYNRKEARP
ncbi:MAG: hypothetical protein BIFFINMI_00727 [Phycisphaerae bacterium]|nr:hypothetical protein [Phycisphaerae bacterium]